MMANAQKTQLAAKKRDVIKKIAAKKPEFFEDRKQVFCKKMIHKKNGSEGAIFLISV
jgi:hypothetical protein